MVDFGGIFFYIYDDIVLLKGIGFYIVGVIVSILFNLLEFVVDGNVMCVMVCLFEVNYDIGDFKNCKIF